MSQFNSVGSNPYSPAQNQNGESPAVQFKEEPTLITFHSTVQQLRPSESSISLSQNFPDERGGESGKNESGTDEREPGLNSSNSSTHIKNMSSSFHHRQMEKVK